MKRRWQDHIIFIIGIWLVASPWALGAYGSDSLPVGLPAWNFFLSGLIVAALGAAAYGSYNFLRYTENPPFTWNALLLGLLLIVLAAWVLLRKRSVNVSERDA
jgi:hypothetical protein